MDTLTRLIISALLFVAFDAMAFGKSEKNSENGWYCGDSAADSPYQACLPLWEASSKGKRVITAYACSSPNNGTSNCTGAFYEPGYGSYGWQAQARHQTKSICPSNSKEKNNSCECDLGFKPGTNGGKFECVPYNCPLKGSYTAVTQPDLYVSNPGPICSSGCEYSAHSFKVAPDGRVYGTWPFTSQGKLCGGTPKDGFTTGETKLGDAPIPCGPGQCPGTVQGASVCVPCQSTSIPGASTAASGAGAGNTGPGGVTVPDGGKATQETTCSQSTCTTTTTVTDAAGTVVGTKSEERPKENFCKDNPDVQICKKGNWGGDCGGYNCEGDPVQCALTREIHKRNCQIFETPNPLAEAGAAAMNNESTPEGHPGKNPETKGLAGALTGQGGGGGGGAGACLPDKQVSIAGQTAVIPWSQACDPLRVMGHIAFAFALVHCAFFVVRKV